MQKTLKRHHYILVGGILFITIVGMLLLMTGSAEGQCAPFDLNCMNLP